MNQLNNNQFTTGASEKPQLCRICCEFFGNAHTDNMCSKCFKSSSKPKTETVNVLPEQVLAKVEETVQVVSTKMEEEKASSDNKEQHDHKKCFMCPKKVGTFGMKCKCGYTYCKSHRLPEDHECSFNFREEAVKKLTKENPTVVASKLERI